MNKMITFTFAKTVKSHCAVTMLLCTNRQKKKREHSFLPVEQVPNDKLPDPFEHKEIDKVKEAEKESHNMPGNEISPSNILQKYTCFVCHNQLSKCAKTSNGHGLLFCSEQCLEHYSNNSMNKSLDLSLIPEEVIDEIMMPLINTKAFPYLKCTNSKWKRRIEEYAGKRVPIFRSIAKFGTYGCENGQFKGPWFVITDKQGDIYVSDCYNHRIQKFSSNGQWRQSIGSYGSGNGQFNYTRGIACNSKNHMFVVDCRNHRIQEFDENMQFIKAFGSEGDGNGQFQEPHGIAADADDNIVVADNSNHRLQIFSIDGNWKKTIGKRGSGDGEFVCPWSVAVCKTSGRIFVSDSNHRVQVFGSDGKFLFKFGSEGSGNGQFKFPSGLALSNCGQYLYVCDYWNHRIQLFKAMNGEFVKTYGLNGSGDGQFKHPVGVCISQSGKIIVSESGKHRVQIFE